MNIELAAEKGSEATQASSMGYAQSMANSSRRLPATILLCTMALLITVVNCDDGSPADVAQTASGTSSSSDTGVGGVIFGDGGPGTNQGGSGGTTMSVSSGQGASSDGGHGMASYVFDKIVNGSANINASDVAIDSQGNMIVVGTYGSGSVSFGGSTFTGDAANDAFVVKFDGAGNHLWSIGTGSSDFQGAAGVAVDSQDNVIVVGSFTNQVNFGGGALDNSGNHFPDIFLVKLDKDGNQVWAQKFGDGIADTDFGNGVAVDPQDNIIITGQFQNQITIGSTTLKAASGGDGFSMLLAKFQPSGTPVFSKSYGDSKTQDGVDVATALDGSIALVGTTNGSIDFGGGNLVNTAGQRVVVAKLTANGDQTLARLFAGEGNSAGIAVAFDKSGELYVTGNFKKSIDLGDGALTAEGSSDEVFLGRYDTNGNLVYGVRFGDGGLDQVNDLAIDSMGYAVLVGKFGGSMRINSVQTLTATSAFDGFVMKVAPDGHGFWGVGVSGDQVQAVTGVAIGNGDFSIVSGSFNSNVDLGGGSKTAMQNTDMFVAKYGP